MKANSLGTPASPNTVLDRTLRVMLADPCRGSRPVYKGSEAFWDLLGQGKIYIPGSELCWALGDRQGKAQGDSFCLFSIFVQLGQNI